MNRAMKTATIKARYIDKVLKLLEEQDLKNDDDVEIKTIGEPAMLSDEH